MKTMLLILPILALVPVACAPEVCPPVPDMEPIGDGLKVIGFALIGMAVVITAGRLVR